MKGTPPTENSLPEDDQSFIAIPDYGKDLNACAEMENVLDGNQCFEWQKHMRSILGLDGGGIGLDKWEFAHASASQRREAFLRTIGKLNSKMDKYE